MGNYIYTTDPHLLDNSTRLESLEICLLNEPLFPRRGGPNCSSFDGMPSKCVAAMLQRNRELKHLSIRINATNHVHMSHDLLLTEQAHALENIAPASLPLKSLSLRGNLHFNDRAWSSWSNVWTNLRSLSVTGYGVTREMINHLEGSLPALRALRLKPYPPVHLRDASFDPNTFCHDIEAFLCRLRLTDLSLVGCPSNIILALKDDRSTLQSVCFHHDLGSNYLLGSTMSPP